MEKRVSYRKFTVQNFKKNRRTGEIAAALIALFELVFLCRTIIFLPGRSYQIGYMVCYTLLLIDSLACLAIDGLEKKGKLKEIWIYGMIHVFDVAIMIWGIAISYFDGLHEGYPIVFITIAFALPFFLVLHPVINSTITILGIGFLLISRFRLYPDTSNGYAWNLLVCAVMIVLICYMHYRTVKKEFFLEEKLLDSSLHDGLTGLRNRRAMDDCLEKLAVGECMSSVIMLDCDYFKNLNDTYGHRFGDDCLYEIAHQLKENFGEDCYRYGGDEFLVVTSVSNQTAIEKMKGINENLKKIFHDAPVSLTAGIVNINGAMEEKLIIQKADRALYEAKEEQRGICRIYRE